MSRQVRLVLHLEANHAGVVSNTPQEADDAKRRGSSTLRLLVGGGVNPLPEMQDNDVMSFLREAGDGAEYVTSVCTGALILAEAGLLRGYRATTHWAYRERLARYPGVEVVTSRVVTDRNRITGGGVTAGIDFGPKLTGGEPALVRGFCIAMLAAATLAAKAGLFVWVLAVVVYRRPGKNANNARLSDRMWNRRRECRTLACRDRL